MTETLLEVTDLRVNRGGAGVLDIPSFRIYEGEVLSLIGPNGSGKTTFLETVACLLKPVSGELKVRGARVGSDISFLQYRRRLAMVFQEPLLFDTTVYNNVASGMKVRGFKGSQIRPLAMEQLERFGISHLAGRAARKLSGGEAQRTSLARAMATAPEVLLLDEPFASLDLPSRETLIGDLQDILKSTRTTTVLATHDRTEALRLSHRIGVMREGRIIQVGTPEEVMNHPADAFVASFVGVETILKGTVREMRSGSFLTAVKGGIIEAVGEVQVGEEVILCVRPEDVTLTSNTGKGPTSARNLFHGRIAKVTSMGLFQKIDVDCGFPLVAYITHHSFETMQLREGNEIDAHFKATAVHVIRREKAQI